MRSGLHTYAYLFFQVDVTWQSNWAKYIGSGNEFIFCLTSYYSWIPNLLHSVKSAFVFVSGTWFFMRHSYTEALTGVALQYYQGMSLRPTFIKSFQNRDFVVPQFLLGSCMTVWVFKQALQ